MVVRVRAVVFFFQAEDGIRDLTVTGVQTCALPIYVAMPPEQWDDFTDFGVTDFDSSGQQVGQGALNYACGRHAVDARAVAALRGHALTVELFPAFARYNGAHPWRATVRVRFLLAQPRAVGGGTDVHVVAGGRAIVPLPRPPALTLPEGFTPLIEVRIHPSDGIGVDAVPQLTAPLQQRAARVPRGTPTALGS